MLVVDIKFIEQYCSEYDRRNRGTQDQIQEIAILNWVCAQSPPRFLNKEYFIRLGRWKTPRYQATRERNNEKDIIEITRSSYLAQDDLEKLNILKRLKGVGVAVASTILYFLEPDKFAIFDYHVRNTLRKAGKLSKGEEDSSRKAWLKYIQVIRELSSLNSKTLREVEKALFAYDKWGYGVNIGGNIKGGVERMDKNEGLEIALPPQKMELLKRIAEDEFGVNASALAKFWIIEKLLEQCPPQNSPRVTMSPLQSQQLPTIREKIKSVVEKNWDYGQPFSRGELINKVQKEYPEVKANEIMPADRAINKLSGYNKTDAGWKKKDPYLFACNDGRYERYDTAHHGSFECIDDGNGYKKLTQKNVQQYS